jgi:5S rRNA maturation endonuclease (ribonuclease M5)
MQQIKKLEMLEKLIEDLIEANKELPVIVEGESDRNALVMLGLDGEIITINAGMSLEAFAEWISMRFNRVILLLDWDRKGFLLTVRVSKLLLANNVTVQLTFWEKIKDLVSKEIKDVECMYNLLEKTRRKVIKNYV